MQPIGAGDGADFLADPLDELFLQRVRGFFAEVQRDIGINALALDIMWGSLPQRFSDFRVGDEGALDFCCAHPVARYVDHVVNAARDPVVAILIPRAAVAGEVAAWICGEIGFDEALVIAVDRAHLPGQLSEMQRLPSHAPSSGVPSASTIKGCTPKNGFVAEPGFSAVAPGSGVMRMPPVSVCHQVSTIGQRSSPTTL